METDAERKMERDNTRGKEKCRERYEIDTQRQRKWAEPDLRSPAFTVICGHSMIYRARPAEYFIVIHGGG